MHHSDMYGELPGDGWMLSSLSEAAWSFATKLSIIITILLQRPSSWPLPYEIVNNLLTLIYAGTLVYIR